MTGDLTLYSPGAKPGVLVVADGDGNVPTRGDQVGIVGESSGNVHVSFASNAGETIGTLARDPEEYDANMAYSADQEVGLSEVLLRHFVDWMTVADGFAPSAGDLVVGDTNGDVRAADLGGTDTANMVYGPIWTTIARADYTAGKVAVVRHK